MILVPRNEEENKSKHTDMYLKTDGRDEMYVCIVFDGEIDSIPDVTVAGGYC